jgi:hypothetical protein
MFFILCLSSACLILTIVLLARIAITLSFELVPEKKSVSLALHWMHPSVIRGAIDVTDKILEIWLLGKFRVWPIKIREKDSSRVEKHFPDRSLPSQPIEVNDKRESFRKEAQPTDSKPAHVNEPSEKSGSSDEKTDTVKRKSVKEKIAGVMEKMKKSEWMKGFLIVRDTQILSKGLRWLRRCLLSMVHLVSIHSLAVHVRAGLGDPALTAKVFGYCTGMQGAGILSATNQLDLNFEPVFNEESFSVSGNLSLQSSLMRFVVLLSIVVATFPYITAIKIWRKSRRK